MVLKYIYILTYYIKYWAILDSPQKHETFTQCWNNAGLASATLAQPWVNVWVMLLFRAKHFPILTWLSYLIGEWLSDWLSNMIRWRSGCDANNTKQKLAEATADEEIMERSSCEVIESGGFAR